MDPGTRGRDLVPVTEACGVTSTRGSLASYSSHILPPPPPVLGAWAPKVQEVKSLEKCTVQI